VGLNLEEIHNVFNKKADYYDKTLEVLSYYKESANNSGLNLLIWLSDFAIFTLMSSYDLWIILCDYQSAIKKYQQNYYARQASLICFELLSDIPGFFGKEYSELMINKIGDTNINQQAQELRKIFNKLRNDYEPKFKLIRDSTIAHREHNVSKLIDTMCGIDCDWVMEFSLKLLESIERFHILMNNIIKFLDKDASRLGKNDFLEKYKYQGE
jgi:hypothetical protein